MGLQELFERNNYEGAYNALCSDDRNDFILSSFKEYCEDVKSKRAFITDVKSYIINLKDIVENDPTADEEKIQKKDNSLAKKWGNIRLG